MKPPKEHSRKNSTQLFAFLKKNRYNKDMTYVSTLLYSIKTYLHEHEYLLLIMFTILTILLYPVFETSSHGSLAYHGFITILLLIWVASTEKKQKFVTRGLFLWGCALVLNRIDFASEPQSTITLWYMIATFFCFVLITINVILSLLDHEKINKHVILWSIAGYLMIGMVGAYLFAIIETLQPGSFLPAAWLIGNIPSMLYYTFVSMLTLGYGDMVPVWWHAQMWSILVAVIGQLYLVVLMWVLIWKYVRDK